MGFPWKYKNTDGNRSILNSSNWRNSMWAVNGQEGCERSIKQSVGATFDMFLRLIQTKAQASER